MNSVYVPHLRHALIGVGFTVGNLSQPPGPALGSSYSPSSTIQTRSKVPSPKCRRAHRRPLFPTHK